MNTARTTRGRLYVVGLGPGSPGLLAPDASAALAEAEVVVGYRGYLDMIADRLAGKRVRGRVLGQEGERARGRPALAAQGPAAARADLALAVYNPASKARDRQLAALAEILLRHRDPATPVGLVENAFRPGERARIIDLAGLAGAEVSMFTTVVVGNSRTFVSR